MYVITDKNHVIIHISETLDYQGNGNPIVDGGTLAIAKGIVGEISGDIDIPLDIDAFKNTYRDGDFGENANYEPPQATELEKVAAQAMYTAIMTDTLLGE